MEIIEDPLMKLAKKRAGFKINLVSYIVVNAFFWCIWYFTGEGYIWPIWPALGWGIGLTFNYFDAYVTDKHSMVQREYEKLKKEKGII